MQAVQKLARDRLTRAILETLPAITEDIKQYLDGVMTDAAASDEDIQRVLGIFDNDDNPIIFDFVESETKPQVHKGFNIIVNIADVEDLVISIVPADFIANYFDGIDIDINTLRSCAPCAIITTCHVSPPFCFSPFFSRPRFASPTTLNNASSNASKKY